MDELIELWFEELEQDEQMKTVGRWKNDSRRECGMTLSIKQTGTTALTVAALGWTVACGSEESVAPTGLPMRQVSSVENAEPTTIAPINTPPTIDRLVLRPESPRPGERLTAIVEASDAEGDDMRFDYQWTVDGVQIKNTGPELMLKDVRKGSWVAVAVIAHDSHGESEPYEEQVTVANRPPVLRGVVFEPLGEVSVANDVTAAPRSYDPDGDDVTYEFSWKVNGIRVSTDGAVLPASRFKRGDKIVLEVVANDGDDDSDPLISAPIPVVNARPRITSSPSGFGEENFTYILQVEDPDGDRSLRFHLAKGPDGMSIDNLSGKITWVPNSDQEGSHLVEVTVEDRQGGDDTQSFELTLSFEADEVPASPDR